jgi:L-arabinokinase
LNVVRLKSLVIVFYISGHGFGHATRDLEVIRQIHHQRPAARIIVRTLVPESFLKQSARAPIEVQPCETDTGMAQIDSLRLDEAETIRRATVFYSTFGDRVAAEASVLESVGASVVVGDVPPLAFAAAARAAIPAIALANFTWDWIYARYAAFRDSAPNVLTTIGEAYAATSLALRLPFAGGFATMSMIRDVPLIARRSRRTRDENRRLLNLDGNRPVVLASFGGHQTAIDYGRVASTNGVTLALTDYEARPVREMGTFDGRLRCFTTEALDVADIRYEDLVAAADVVVSKPGYGIVSECIANQAALLHTSRGVFAENEVLLAGMKRVLRNRFISQEDLRGGRWEPSIRELLAEPEPPEDMPINGASVAASAILEVGRR